MKHTNIQIAITSLFISACLMSWTQTVTATGIMNIIDITTNQGEEEIITTGQPGDQFKKTLAIQNSGQENCELNLYLQDATGTNGAFELKEFEGSKADMTHWLTLGQNNVKLQPGETKFVPITISYPENAGIGHHAAAIMASQKITDSAGNIINFDTGIRIHATVNGASAIQKYKLLNSQQEIADGKFTYRTTLINTGNTDLRGEIKLANQAVKQDNHQSREILLRPGEDQNISLQTTASSFGSEHIVATIELNNQLKAFVLSDRFVFPITEALILLLLGLAISFLLVRRKKQTVYQGNLLLLILVGFISTSILLSYQAVSKNLQANLFGPDEQAYLTTIKWGSFQDQQVPEGTVTNWSGYINLKEGQMFLVEKLHNEQTDKIELNAAGDNLTFRNTTGPNNDGIIVLIKVPSNTVPTLVFHNNLTGEEIKVPIESTLKSARYIQYKQQHLEISSETAPALINLIGENNIVETPLADIGTDTIEPIIEVESTPDITVLLEDLEASGDQSLATATELLDDQTGTADLDIEITAEEIIVDLQATFDQMRMLEEIKLLAELIKDIPSSPDVISEYILNSAFISAITADNNATTVIGSSRLIRLLKDTPLIIREITATPDSNFLFLPNDTIKLGTQSFSFNERKLSSQELNEIIFVQKKTTPWTVYFSISNLTATNGSDTIAASNVTFSPGEINIVNQSGTMPLIEAGSERKMTNPGDLIKLFSITPLDDSRLTFSMRPRISVFVPPKTLPGLYRAEITFKAI